jgi:hypothetical protein
MPLSLQDLCDLRAALLTASYFLRDLEKDQLFARFIKGLQVPSIFSESLAFYLLERGLLLPELRSCSFVHGKKKADVIAYDEGKEVHIEVKATGDKGFQRLGPKDLIADYLVWFQFDNFFKINEAGMPIQVWTVEKPGRFFSKPGIVSLAAFKKKADSALSRTDIIFDALK